MKSLFASIFLFLCLSISVQAQNKLKTDTISVKGNCGECKERIEEAVYKLKGIKTVSWDKKTKVLNVVYNPSKTNLVAIEKEIAKAGHDTPNQTASDAAYKTLPGCCAYRNGQSCSH